MNKGAVMPYNKIIFFSFLLFFSVISCSAKTPNILDQYINIIDDFNKKEMLEENYYSKAEYQNFRKYYTKVLSMLRSGDYDNCVNTIDKYVKMKAMVFNVKDNDFNSQYNNFEVYRFISLFNLIKGIIKINKGEKREGSELIYLSFYILKKYNMIETDDFTGEYAVILYDLLRKDDISMTLEELKKEHFNIEPFFSLKYIKTTNVRLNPIMFKTDKEYEKAQSILTDLTPGSFRNNPIEDQYKVRYFSLFIPIEDSIVFVNNAVDDYSREFMAKVRNEVGLNFREEAGTEYNYSYIKIMVNDELGLRLLKKHVLDL